MITKELILHIMVRDDGTLYTSRGSLTGEFIPDVIFGRLMHLVDIIWRS